MLGAIYPDNANQPYIGEDIERSLKSEAMQRATDEINGDAPADKRIMLFGAEFMNNYKIKFKREGLSDNPADLWEQRHRIRQYRVAGNYGYSKEYFHKGDVVRPGFAARIPTTQEEGIIQ